MLQRPGAMLVGIVVLALLLLLLSHERAQHSHSLHLASDAGSSGHAMHSDLEMESPQADTGDIATSITVRQPLPYATRTTQAFRRNAHCDTTCFGLIVGRCEAFA